MKSILNKILSFFILLIFFPLFSLLLILVIVSSYVTHPKNTYPIFVPIGAKLIMLSGLQLFSVKGNIPPKEDGPYLFMFNHESMFDVLMLGGAIPYYINAVGWEGIFKIPLFGYMAKRYGAYSITHDNTDKAKVTLKAAEKILLIDKSTSNLDEASRKLIFDLLNNSPYTIINCTHNHQDFEYDDHLKVLIENEKRLIVR